MMITPRGAYLLLFFIVCSCQSSSSRAKLDSRQESQVARFLQAKRVAVSEPPKACESFKTLGDDQKFPLADLAYIRSLQFCPAEAIDWNRPVANWLEKEKQLAQYSHLKTAKEKALFITEHPQYFPSPDRIKMYQQARQAQDLSVEERAKIESALFAIAPRFMPNPPLQDSFKIVKDLKSIREFEKARLLLQKIIGSKEMSLDHKLQAHKELFFLFKLQRNQKHAAYMKAAKDWAEFLSPQKALSPSLISGVYEAKLNYARVVWTENGAERALKIMDQIQKQMQGKTSLYDVYWLKARMLEEKKQTEAAIVQYERSLKEKISQWRDQEKILWSLAWTYFKLKRYPSADQHFQTMIQHKETSAYARFKYSYWLAESLREQNKLDEAKKVLTSLSEEDAFGYYGLLALHRLNKPLRNISANTSLGRPLSEADDEIFQMLQQLGEPELPGRFLASALPDTTSLKKAPATDIAAIMGLYSEIKNYKYIFQLFNQVPFEVQREVFLKVPHLIFPQPYNELTSESFAKTQVEPELVYSIMRQESSFDPQARSPMDAMGLVQVLPEVAKRIANENNIAFGNYEDLYDEQKNILIGSFLLKKQKAAFNNKFPLYVASYNASSTAVRRWHERFTGSDDVMFIEEIPYEETKTYVKLVLRNLVLYRKLKSGEAMEFFPKDLILLAGTAEKSEDSSQKN